MLKLSVSYSDRPEAEFPMLFQRILRNVVFDALRRTKVRNTWVTLFSAFSRRDEGDDDVLETLSAEAHDGHLDAPHVLHERHRTLAAIEHELERLPARQREAFLMRYWEEMTIAETAVAMGCSEGSVKTHCSRASQTMAAALRTRGIVP